MGNFAAQHIRSRGVRCRICAGFILPQGIRRRERVLSGLIEYLESFKEGEKADFADKIMASMYTVMAYIHTLEGKPAEAAECLRGVLAAVRKFDAMPDYGIRTLRYPVHRTDVILNDVMGATAADSIETILDLLGNQELSKSWKELVANER